MLQSSLRLHGEEIKFGEKQPSDLRQSCAQPSMYELGPSSVLCYPHFQTRTSLWPIGQLPVELGELTT